MPSAGWSNASAKRMAVSGRAIWCGRWMCTVISSRPRCLQDPQQLKQWQRWLAEALEATASEAERTRQALNRQRPLR